MAAVYGSVANVGNILKKYYEDDVQFINGEESMPILKEFEDAGVVEVNGDGDSWNVDTEPPFGGGVGPYSEEGDLPEAHEQNSQQALMQVKLIAATFSISEKLMEAAANNKGAFAKGLDFIMKKTRIKFDRLQWFILHSDGTGCAGKVLSVGGVGNKTVTLDTTATDAPTLALYANPGDVHIAVSGAKIAVGGTVRATKPKVAPGGVADDFSTITYDADVSAWQAGDYIFLKGCRDETVTSTFYVPNGFLNMNDNSAVHLYDPATYGWWKSKTIDGGGLLPTEDIIMRMVRKGSFRNNGRKFSHMMYNQVHAQDLVKLYQGRQHEEYKGGKVTPGNEGLSPWHIPFGAPMKNVEDDYQPPGRLDFFDIKVYRRQWLKKPSMLDKGSYLSALRIDNKALWVGHITAMMNQFCRMRPATGFISNVAYSATLW